MPDASSALRQPCSLDAPLIYRGISSSQSAEGRARARSAEPRAVYVRTCRCCRCRRAQILREMIYAAQEPRAKARQRHDARLCFAACACACVLMRRLHAIRAARCQVLSVQRCLICPPTPCLISPATPISTYAACQQLPHSSRHLHHFLYFPDHITSHHRLRCAYVAYHDDVIDYDFQRYALLRCCRRGMPDTSRRQMPIFSLRDRCRRHASVR